ncbi:hypothetical protein BDQ12DRAFT_692600 [Crucibulum laeve]|uniref:Uncharacterized protein n=1 Tax=Crucibulum laeve TaxID=68775 RepID=A0A5C3LGW1_9AGAR|nr:hypothetical protein BDQ12DRAFT_693125 [Crucibulum laeve]TFK32317.1 hypothetical protein BDQ12DRAFT_692600 [Crucibulum laeve]
MKSSHLARVLITLLLVVVSVALAFELDAVRDDLYTPAEVRRNTQRKALGLPPLGPKAARKRVARQGKPNRGGMPGVIPASVAAHSSTGHIAVYYGSLGGPLLGFLSQHKLTTMENATQYTYNFAGSLMQINVANSNQRMAVAAGLYGRTLGPGSKNFHLARHTRISTPAHELPRRDEETAMHIETTVFAIDPATGEIDVHWVNPDGKLAYVQVVVLQERIYYTGDPEALEAYAGDTVHTVVYKWVPMEG